MKVVCLHFLPLIVIKSLWFLALRGLHNSLDLFECIVCFKNCFCWSFAATTLTSWHLLVTFLSLHVAQMLKLFEHKPFDPRTVVGFGVLNGISIGLLNLCLGFNSVGFYQVNGGFLIFMCVNPWKALNLRLNNCPFPWLACFHSSSKSCCYFVQMTKLAIIPCTILLETLFLRKTFRSGVLPYFLFHLSLANVSIALKTKTLLNFT